MKKYITGHNLWYPPLLASILYGIYVVASNFSSPENFSWIFLAKSILQFYGYLFLVNYADQWVERKGPWGKVSKNILTFVFGWILSLLLGVFLYVVVKQAFITFGGQNDRIGFYHHLLNILSISIGYVLIFSVYKVSKSQYFQVESELKSLRYEKEKLRLEYEILYNKLEPHFLFNNLNTLHSLIVNKEDAAESYVMSLSKVMRYSYQSREKESVPLELELDVFDHYRIILEERFGEALSFSINAVATSARQIVPMTLLNLLENVIKHNEISEEKPINIGLELSEDTMVMSNTLQSKETEERGSGLAALSNMYRIKTGKEVMVSSESGIFKVRVPLIAV